MRENTTNLKDLADTLAQRLLAEGFTVQRYDAYSTDSVYLKLDYGVCNSIRISDHTGKKKLQYRYNIGTDIESIRHEKPKRRGEYPRHYWPARKMEKMVDWILKDRKEKQERYGKDRYYGFVQKNKMEHANDAGFWRNSYLVYPEKKETYRQLTLSDRDLEGLDSKGGITL